MIRSAAAEITSAQFLASAFRRTRLMVLKDWDNTVKKFWKAVPNPPTPETPKALYRFDEASAPALA